MPKPDKLLYVSKAKQRDPKQKYVPYRKKPIPIPNSNQATIKKEIKDA
jgi:hypothetical protein